MSRAPDERELLGLGDEIAGYTKPRASARLRAELRASLLSAPVAAPRRSPFASLFAAPLRAGLAAALVLAVLVGAAGAAAASSLPGDPAFALARAAETLEIALARNDAARLEALVAQADRRLEDLRRALAVRPANVPAAVDEYEAAVARLRAAVATVLAETPSAERDAALARASEESDEHLAALEALAARLPAAAQPGIERAIEAQRDVHGGANGPRREMPVPTDGTAPVTTMPPARTTSPGRPSATPSRR